MRQHGYPSVTDRVQDTLQHFVDSGLYPPGAKLPAQNQLCRDLGVGKNTMRRAIANLIKVGVLRQIPRRGIYVK